MYFEKDQIKTGNGGIQTHISKQIGALNQCQDGGEGVDTSFIFLNTKHFLWTEGLRQD